MKKYQSLISGLYVIFFLFFESSGAFAQNKINGKKIMVLEKLTQKKYMPPSAPVTFREGNRVIIRYNNNKQLKGKINAVYDSSLNIEGNIIYIKNINRIRSYRGTETIATGMSLLAIATNIRLYADNAYHPDYDEYGDDMNRYALFDIDLVSLIFAYVGGVEAIVGLIRAVSAKNYHLDENLYKVYVMPKAEFDKRQSALSPPYQRTPKKNKTENLK